MIVILGGTGYIGTAFRSALESSGEKYVSVSQQRCQYYDSAALDDMLVQTRPRFLINAAGFAGRDNVDACELAKTECLLAKKESVARATHARLAYCALPSPSFLARLNVAPG